MLSEITVAISTLLADTAYGKLKVNTVEIDQL
jgi:hypothetical protein